MQIIGKIIITIVIIALLFGGICAIVRVWKSDLDIPKTLARPFSFFETKKPFIPPKPIFEIVALPSNYSPGLKVHDVVWSNDYHLYRFKISNTSDQVPLHDVRIGFEMPGGFVSKKVINRLGIDGLSFSEAKMPLGIAKRQAQGMGKLVKTIPYYTNRLSIGVSKLNQQAVLEIDFVIKIIAPERGGYFSITYSYLNPEGETKAEQHLHPIVKSNRSHVFKIDSEVEITGKHQRCIALIPDKTIVFKPDGSVELKDE